MRMKRKRKNTTIQYRHGCEQNPMWSFRWDFRFPVLLLVSSVLLLTGCAGETKSAGSANTGNYNKGNSVSGVLESRTAENVSRVGQDNGKVKGTEDEESLEDGNSPEGTQSGETAAFANNISTVDYDLTEMSSDMVYAMVYQMMMEPEKYEGKTFRMEGIYYTVYSEDTKKYYHYCIIQDATACCAQGMEFVWDDGSHAYPDEYPEENADVIVEGTFETYTESGDSNLYCRLKDASMEVE